jgi:hypothetical protein
MNGLARVGGLSQYCSMPLFLGGVGCGTWWVVGGVGCWHTVGVLRDHAILLGLLCCLSGCVSGPVVLVGVVFGC